jgi:hypothetical protein
MTPGDVSRQLMRGLGNLRADVRENGILMEQMRGELKAVHKLVDGVQEQLADVPKRDEFDELRADVNGVNKVADEPSGELAQLDARGSAADTV